MDKNSKKIYDKEIKKIYSDIRKELNDWQIQTLHLTNENIETIIRRIIHIQSREF